MCTNDSKNATMKKKGRITIFDDVFRTIIEKMPFLVIPLINEAFGTDYTMDETVVQFRNEHHQMKKRTDNTEIITDSYISIRDNKYHIECQSVDATNMAIRMVEYDFEIGLENAIKAGRNYTIRLPKSCILFLRSTSETPDQLNVKIISSNDEELIHCIKCIKCNDYTKEDMFQKQLLILLPFYMMRYERYLKNDEKDSKSKKNLEKINIMINDYQDIITKLITATEDEQNLIYRDIIVLINKIADYILRSNKRVKERIETMRGNILRLPSDDIKEAKESLFKTLDLLISSGKLNEEETLSSMNELDKVLFVQWQNREK